MTPHLQKVIEAVQDYLEVLQSSEPSVTELRNADILREFLEDVEFNLKGF